LSSVTEIKDIDAFVHGFEKEYWTQIRKAIRGMRSPDTIYVVHITGKEATSLNGWCDMIDWCMDNVSDVPGVRTEYAAITRIGIYMFLKHADALAFYFRFGGEYV
jgi:hypothetical protein